MARIIRNGSGQPTRMIGVGLDVSARKQAEEALRTSEERLRLALEAAKAGTWESVPETGDFSASERAIRLHGLSPGVALTHHSALEAVHPAD